MSTQSIEARSAPATLRVASYEHRAFVHPVTRADCRECLPAPCVCGEVLCPDAFEHRRDLWSNETTWRVA